MRSGRVEKAAALASKIGHAIKNYTSAEFSRVQSMSCAKTVWIKLCQLTGRSKDQANYNCHSGLSADKLNDHYATIIANYAAPGIKCSCSSSDAFDPISEWRIFNILDALRHTSTGLENIPAWFLRIGAPFFVAPLAEISGQWFKNSGSWHPSYPFQRLQHHIFSLITDQSLTLPLSPEFWSVLLLGTTSTHLYALHPPV